MVVHGTSTGFTYLAFSSRVLCSCYGHGELISIVLDSAPYRGQGNCHPRHLHCLGPENRELVVVGLGRASAARIGGTMFVDVRMSVMDGRM